MEEMWASKVNMKRMRNTATSNATRDPLLTTALMGLSSVITAPRYVFLSCSEEGQQTVTGRGGPRVAPWWCCGRFLCVRRLASGEGPPTVRLHTYACESGVPLNGTKCQGDLSEETWASGGDSQPSTGISLSTLRKGERKRVLMSQNGESNMRRSVWPPLLFPFQEFGPFYLSKWCTTLILTFSRNPQCNWIHSK